MPHPSCSALGIADGRAEVKVDPESGELKPDDMPGEGVNGAANEAGDSVATGGGGCASPRGVSAAVDHASKVPAITWPQRWQVCEEVRAPHSGHRADGRVLCEVIVDAC